MIQAGATGILETLPFTNVDGLQVDWSFFMHGAELYNASYGQVWLGNHSKWANMLRFTAFSYSPAQ